MAQLAIPIRGKIQRVGQRTARFRQEILRVGRFNMGGRPWNVDRALLQRIEANFKRQLSNGVNVPLQWDHSDSARDRIGDVLKLEVVGDGLFADFNAKRKEDIRRLGVTSNEVSVELREPWMDGLGNEYDIALTHLGVVNLPVVPAQGPMIRLSLISGGKRKSMVKKSTRRRLANGEGETVDTEGEDMASESFSIDEFKTAISEYADITFPEDVTTKDAVIAFLKGLKTTPGEMPAEESSEPASTSAEEMVNADPMVQASIKAKDGEISRLRAQLAAAEKRDETFYRSEVEELVTRGSITAAEVDGVISMGKSSKWNTALLGPFKRIPDNAGVKTSEKTRRLSTSARNIDPDDGEMTPERAKEIAKGAYAR